MTLIRTTHYALRKFMTYQTQSAQQNKSLPPHLEIFAELRGDRYIDLEKDTQYSDAWVALAIVVSIVGIIFNNLFLTASALSLLVIAAISRSWSALSLFGLHYRRHFSETRAFMGESVALTLEVQNQKFLPLTWLHIRDIFPATLPLQESKVDFNQSSNLGEFRSFWMLGAFQRVTRHFTIECTHRGFHTYGPATLRTGDGFGLFDCRATLPGEHKLIIYPRLYSAVELKLPAKNPFGERKSERRLFEDPLRTQGIREWQPGDSLKRVHWKATARHRQMLSRLYEPSEEPQTLIFLNVATMPRHWQGVYPELLERTISVAGSLAALSLERRTPTGLIANGAFPGSDQPLRLLPGRGPDQLTRILEMLAAVNNFASRPIEEHLLREAPRLPWGATILVVTAIAHEALLSALVELRKAGRVVVLFTLAEVPPKSLNEQIGIPVYHLPHLVDDVVAPDEMKI